MNLHRALLSCGAAAGGLLAAALLPAAAAVADDTWVLTPDISTFVATQADGFPPFFDHATGTEHLDVLDASPGQSGFGSTFTFGVDTHTVFGSFTNDDLVLHSPDISFGSTDGSVLYLPAGSEIDVANFGDGFINQWLDVPVTGVGPGSITDLLITPFGDFNIPL
jgi:hypothetical protein